jgi:carbon-monoxide dehydrogenase small subunit
MTPIEITLNGKATRGVVEPRMSLADFIRNDCHLTGTHLGCEHGVCGACTLLVDGRPVRSCILLAVAADGANVRTVEGYRNDPVMDVIRDCFSEYHALQCGFCTPGTLASAYDIVNRLPTADRARIREELNGNLCRCTGYIGIINAIEAALRRVHAGIRGRATQEAHRG